MNELNPTSEVLNMGNRAFINAHHFEMPGFEIPGFEVLRLLMVVSLI